MTIKNVKKKKMQKNQNRGNTSGLTKYQKYNIMVTMQKRASGSQVRRNSFVNPNYTPFRVIYLEAGNRETTYRPCPDVRL